MFEDANNIFDYLPIRYQSIVEDEYQWYLWSSFSVLSEDQASQASSFAVMPFHMLFMFAAQYKALRLSKAMPEQYGHAFTFRNIKNHASLLAATSPYDFSDMQERSLFDIFRLAGANEALITSAKNLVDGRNTLAHSNGVIEADVEKNIQKYLDVLEGLQKLFIPFNDTLANEWMTEMEPEDDKTAFVETRLAASYLCPADFDDGLLGKNFSKDSNPTGT